MTVSRLGPIEEWMPPALLAGLRRVGADHRIHVVGGAPRDRWLDRSTADVDLVADGAADELGRRLAEAMGGRFIALAGERFASYRVVAGDLVVDLWGRGDTPLRDELERRDLTINSLAVDVATGSLIDPFGGLEDLERGVLRATSEKSLREDPLRVVRLARFAADLVDFTIEPSTQALAREASEHIGGVAFERIRDEVARTLVTDGRARGVEVLAAAGLYPLLWGGAATAEPAPGTIARLNALAPVAHRLTAGADEDLCSWEPLILAHALLFLPPGGGAAAATASDLLSRRDARRVAELHGLDRLPAGESDGRPFLRRWRRRWCEAAVFALLGGDLPPAAEPRRRANRLASLARRHGRRIFDLPTLLDGHEIARLLGLAPGPEIGRVLAALEAEQVAGRVETPDEARAFISGRSRPTENREDVAG